MKNLFDKLTAVCEEHRKEHLAEFEKQREKKPKVAQEHLYEASKAMSMTELMKVAKHIVEKKQA